jgi:hypothetical protein
MQKRAKQKYRKNAQIRPIRPLRSASNGQRRAAAIAFGLAAKDVVRDMLRGEPVRRSAPKEEEFHHL